MCSVLFIVCLYICVCECLLQNNNHKTKHKNNTTSKEHSCVRGPLQECRSIRSGASGLPYYCAPLVCVSEVIESLAVWRHYKSKTKKFTNQLLQNNNHKTKHKNNTTSKQHEYVRGCGSAVRFGQALQGYLIAAHHLYVSLR